jgi:N-acetyl-alpha-D-glucosaminyl L-malate synthase BshA
VFALIAKEIPSKLILIGDGPDRFHAERLARELGINEKVIFLGKLRDTAHVLSFSDLFLLPSETESFGLAALEAMAVGVPVISSNTGGIPEVNAHGFSGYLSNVGDVEDMAKNACFVLSEKNIDTFKKQAKIKAKEFTLDLILPKYEEIYRKLV